MDEPGGRGITSAKPRPVPRDPISSVQRFPLHPETAMHRAGEAGTADNVDALHERRVPRLLNVLVLSGTTTERRTC